MKLVFNFKFDHVVYCWYVVTNLYVLFLFLPAERTLLVSGINSLSGVFFFKLLSLKYILVIGNRTSFKKNVNEIRFLIHFYAKINLFQAKWLQS